MKILNLLSILVSGIWYGVSSIRKYFIRYTKYEIRERGDTIVEVVLATAIIATAIGIAYSVANRNLQNGISAGQRSQALSLASAQIERLKNAHLTNSADLNKYTIDKPFCILSDGGVEDVDKQDSKCTNFNATQFSLNVNYKNDSRLFSAKLSWRSNTNVAISDELTLYYKLPEVQQ